MPRKTSIVKKVSVFDLRRHGLPVRKIATKLKLSNITKTRVSNYSRKSLINNRQKRKIEMASTKYPFMTANQLKISENLSGYN